MSPNAIPWEQILFQFGGFGVIALFFYIWMRRDWKRQDCERAKWEERQKRWDTIISAALEAQNNSNTLISNCLTHQERAFDTQGREMQRMTNAVDRLCDKL